MVGLFSHVSYYYLSTDLRPASAAGRPPSQQRWISPSYKRLSCRQEDASDCPPLATFRSIAANPLPASSRRHLTNNFAPVPENRATAARRKQGQPVHQRRRDRQYPQACANAAGRRRRDHRRGGTCKPGCRFGRDLGAGARQDLVAMGTAQSLKMNRLFRQ